MYEGLVGETINSSYKIQSLLGVGGMGFVYEALQLGLERTVAIKIMHPLASKDKDSSARFLREGKHLSTLSHPHITSFYEFGFWKDSIPFISMELVNGEDLSQILEAETRLAWRRALLIAIQICDAMGYAHSQHIINRDLKPQNIMIAKSSTGDFVKLIDFGLAKLLPAFSEEEDKLTKTGSLVGTFYYMSPEQCTGQASSEQSDIYSLGCVLYELLTGMVPFLADTPVGMLHKHVYDSPARFEEVLPDEEFPQGLESCIFKAMAKDPDERYQSMDALAKDLQLLLNDRVNEVSAGLSVFQPSIDEQSKAKSRIQVMILPIALLASLALCSYFFVFADPGIAYLQAFYLSNSPGKRSIEDCLAESKKSADRSHKSACLLFCRTAISLTEKIKLNQLEKAMYYSKASELAFACNDRTESIAWALDSLQAFRKFRLSNLSSPVSKQEVSIVQMFSSILLADRQTSLDKKDDIRQLYKSCKAVPDCPPELKLELNKLLYYHDEIQYRRALASTEKSYGLYHPNVVERAYNLAICLNEQERFKEAEPLFRQLVAIREKMPEASESRLAEAIWNLANCYDHQGKLSEALPLYERSALMLSKIQHASPIDLADMYFRLAEKYIGRGRLAEAEELYKHSIAIRMKLFQRTPDRLNAEALSEALSKLALCSEKQNKFEAAESLYRRAIALDEKDSAQLATVLFQQATFYQNRGKFAESISIYKQCLAIREKTAQNKPDLAVHATLKFLADSYYRKGEMVKAIPLYERSLAMGEKFGESEVDLPSILSCLGLCYYNQGKYLQAEQFFKRSILFYEKPGHSNALFALALCHLADCYCKQNKFVEAEPLYKQSLSMYDALGQMDLDFATILTHMADCYFIQHDVKNAMPLYKRYLALAAKLHVKSSETTAYSLRLAACKKSQRNLP